jgi:phospholipid/cholesterol/gamma-HCH transport system ATP-binding protein
MPDSSSIPIVEFDRVNVSFDDQQVLRDISFRVMEGETRLILGSAGSGKTVLLKTALGLVLPDSGRVLLFGTDIAQLREKDQFAIRQRAGMLFQEGALFDSLTIEENVAYPLVTRENTLPDAEVHEKVKEALRFVELEHTLEKFPSELSGGMRRRVGIARAAVTQPPLILYDSPTAGLDPITANTIIALIVKERDTLKTTSMVVTHRYQDGHILANFRYNSDSGELNPVSSNGGLASLKTMFMVLKEGQLVFEGTESELEASRDSYLAKFVKR